VRGTNVSPHSGEFKIENGTGNINHFERKQPHRLPCNLASIGQQVLLINTIAPSITFDA
jgi:hypothetical protein